MNNFRKKAEREFFNKIKLNSASITSTNNSKNKPQVPTRNLIYSFMYASSRLKVHFGIHAEL